MFVLVTSSVIGSLSSKSLKKATNPCLKWVFVFNSTHQSMLNKLDQPILISCNVNNYVSSVISVDMGVAQPTVLCNLPSTAMTFSRRLYE